MREIEDADKKGRCRSSALFSESEGVFCGFFAEMIS
jgi:hypothetical protein